MCIHARVKVITLLRFECGGGLLLATDMLDFTKHDMDCCKIKVERRCFRVVDLLLDDSPELITVDEQSNDQIVHTLRLRKADRAAH